MSAPENSDGDPPVAMVTSDPPVAIVTGGARGIGRAAVLGLARKGFRVAIVDQRADAAAETEAAAVALGAEVLVSLGDVSDFQGVQRQGDGILGQWGRIDVLVNNAGISQPKGILEISEAEWDHTIAVDLKGYFNWCRRVAPEMAARKRGRIVNISSVNANTGSGPTAVSKFAYATAKAGILGMTRGLARELAPDVFVNAICPGAIFTDLTRERFTERREAILRSIPMNRMGTPEDIAEVVVFLATVDPCFLTGEVIDVDGGPVDQLTDAKDRPMSARPQDTAEGTGLCDPIALEVISGALRSSQKEMEALIERTAMSDFIREKKDFFVALFDAAGDLVVGAYRPTFGDPIRPVFKHYPAEAMRPGDLYWYNDCYGSQGSVSHSNDQVFLAPIFVDGELLGFSQSWAHFADIGGMRPGSISPDTTDIFQEGVIIPPVRLAREGETNDDLIRILVRNSRFPEILRGDIRACVAAVRLGERRIQELAERFDAARLADAFRQLNERSERAARQRLRDTFPKGRYVFGDAIDKDGQGNGPFWMRMELAVEDNGVTLDFSASDDQAPGPINYLVNPTVPRAMLGMYLLAGDPTLMLNAGACRAIDHVVLREGSLLQPRWPAPLGNRGITMMRLISSCMGLVNAAGGESTAANCAYVIYFVRGVKPDGTPFLMSDGLGVGYGARPFADGIDSVYYVAQENFPAEMLEQTYPIRVRAYGVNKDSGGPGRWRGGCGVVREIEVLAERATFSIRIDGVSMPAWGVKGGRNGGAGHAIVNPGTDRERVLEPFSDGNVLTRGEVLRLETGGGGGWGHPFDREPERVLRDVRDGFVSVVRAAADYGVVIAEDGQSIDAMATEARRRQRPAADGLFHRHDYRDGLE